MTKYITKYSIFSYIVYITKINDYFLRITYNYIYKLLHLIEIDDYHF